MHNLKRRVDLNLRDYVGIGLVWALLIPLALVILGVAAGLLLPKFEAKAVLQFPEATPAQKLEANAKAGPQIREASGISRLLESNMVELPTYKRVAAAYESVAPLQAYVEALGISDRPSVARILKQANDPGFWAGSAQPILPFSRRDQREFGDIKGASGATILGLELTADARTEAIARDMIDVLAAYYVNAVVRERIRAWALVGKVESQPQEKRLRADVVRAELDIELYRRRAEDMKTILARYPDAARMDSRQMIAVSPGEGEERYLSPLAQLVGAESAISQRREMISRWQRELKQKSVLASYFNHANEMIERDIDVAKLLPALRIQAVQDFGVEAAEEWSKEAALSIQGALDNFDALRGQFGVRNSVRAGAIGSRDPLRLGVLGALFGIGLLGAIAIMRATLRSGRPNGETETQEGRG